MSILIKGVDMPKRCDECIFDVYGGCLINLNIDPKNKLTHSCPLIEIPAHGDLIDLRELMCEFARFVRRSNNSDFAPTPNWNDAVSIVGSAPVVIPADRSEE